VGTITIQKKTIKVPVVGLGTYKLKGQQGTKAVDYALQIGYRHIDTAQFYDNEEEVGNAVRSSGIDRNDVFITTKVFPQDFKRLVKATEASLRKLKSDYVDLLLLHWPADENSNKIAVDSLNEVLGKGYAKNVGVSNFSTGQLSKAMEVAPVVTNQVEYHPYLSQEKMLSFLKKHDMFLTAYSPLALGKVATDSKLKGLARIYNKSVCQVVLRWLLQLGDVCVIPKSSSFERIEENLDIFDFSLSDEDMKTISGMSNGHRFTNSAWSPL
jgi:2,5-diketo-D-gluconate reductase B